MIIRKMTIADYRQVYDLWMACAGMGLNDVDDSESGVRRFLERNPETCFVSLDESGQASTGDITGVIMAGNDGRRGYIYHTAVAPDHRHQGIASLLVQHACSAFKDLGISKVALVAFSSNLAGNSFWERQGFSLRDDLAYRNLALQRLNRLDT